MSQLGGARRRLTLVGLLAASALAASLSLAVAAAAGASPGADGPGGGPATAVVYQVSTAGQRNALAYWTPARMREAQSAAIPQAVRSEVQPPKGIPTAVHFAGVPTAGALFYTEGTKSHFCSASVVDSTVGDLVLTAAHCVYSTKFASNIEYVPEYHSGQKPYGAWPVRTITVAAGWQKSHDPDLDFAFLAVGTAGGQKIQTVTGGLKPGFTLWYRETIEVVGYDDPDSEPIRCLTKSFPFRPGQMEFYCHGYWTGTSGGPWIIGYNAKNGTGTVFGVIGGYEEGGDYEWASYSSYFGSQARILFGQAENAVTPTPTPTPTPSPTATSTRTAAPVPAPAPAP